MNGWEVFVFDEGRPVPGVKKVVTSNPLEVYTEKNKPYPGLLGKYYNGYSSNVPSWWSRGTDPAATPDLVRIDRNIDFVWGSESPAWNRIQADKFLVVWTGEIYIPSSGNYRFKVSSDDGVRVKVGNSWIYESWRLQSAEWRDTSGISFSSSGWYPIRIEYFECTGDASVRLAWGSNGTIIAPSCFRYIPDENFLALVNSESVLLDNPALYKPISDYEKYIYSLGPTSRDTDSDGLTDGFELHCSPGYSTIHATSREGEAPEMTLLDYEFYWDISLSGFSYGMRMSVRTKDEAGIKSVEMKCGGGKMAGFGKGLLRETLLAKRVTLQPFSSLADARLQKR